MSETGTGVIDTSKREVDIRPIQPPRTGDVLEWWTWTAAKGTATHKALVIVKGSDYYTWDGKTLKSWEAEDLLLFIVKDGAQIHRWKEEK